MLRFREDRTAMDEEVEDLGMLRPGVPAARLTADPAGGACSPERPHRQGSPRVPRGPPRRGPASAAASHREALGPELMLLVRMLRHRP